MFKRYRLRTSHNNALNSYLTKVQGSYLDFEKYKKPLFTGTSSDNIHSNSP